MTVSPERHEREAAQEATLRDLLLRALRESSLSVESRVRILMRWELMERFIRDAKNL